MSYSVPLPIPGLEEPFPREDGVLRCGSRPLPELAEAFGTPLYVYDAHYLESRYRAFCDAFRDTDLLVAYSVKANGNLSLLARLAALGAGADIVSGGELHRARKAGIPAERILFSGVGKTVNEMETALREGIYAFNVESSGELSVLEEVARSHGVAAPVGIRINPDIVASTPHHYTRTGHKRSKFGVPPQTALDLYRWAADRPHLDLVGIDVHLGSQIVDPRPYGEALGALLEMVDGLEREGIGLEYVDLGGGFGVSYGDAPAMMLDELAKRVVAAMGDRELRLVLEPGRYIAGQAGALLTRVLYVKSSRGRTFVVTDSGMTDLIRPSHYGGYHEIEPVVERAGAEERRVDVVGPICETGDFLGLDVELPVPEPGDLLAVRTVGAYGFTMASNYNARPRPAEVMVDGDEARVVRRREVLDDLIRGEELP